MRLRLQETTGLGDSSPLYVFLGHVDEILKRQRSWSGVHRKMPVDEMYEGMLYFLGHPLTRKHVVLVQVREYAKWLREGGETVFAGLLETLMDRFLDEDREEGILVLSPEDIRITMMFILANLEYLKQREGGIRSIDAGWLDE